MLLVNANILTMDLARPGAECVAIRDGTIVYAGSRKAFGKSSGGGFEPVDCGGRTLLPGFIDAHCHLRAFAESLVSLEMGPDKGFHSIADIKKAVGNQYRSTFPGDWIRGRGYDEFHLAEKRHPTRWDLDDVAPDLPVKLTHRSGHAHVLNSVALRLANISVETPDPAGGMIDRDIYTGEPNGILYEMGEFLSKRIPAPENRSFLAGVELANRQLLRSGITSVHDASRSNGMDQWKEFRSWKAEGLFRPAIRMMLDAKRLDECGGVECRNGMEEGTPRITGVKIILDETTGELHPPQEELNEMLLRAHRKSIQVSIHAVEKSTIKAACRAIRYATGRFPEGTRRHRIEHCSVCNPILSRRLASLGVSVVTQPAFIYYSGDRYLETVPRRQLEHLYPLRTLLENGVSVAASSDFPIVPPNPLIGLYSAVTRRSRTGKSVSEGEAIPPWAALRMYTCDAARATLDEGVRGSISPGKAADLILLSDDPTRVAPEEIKDIRVEMTMIAGEVVWGDTA
jgi:predicted amidohydrolase YtcJ